jgi:hypothetical protein
VFLAAIGNILGSFGKLDQIAVGLHPIDFASFSDEAVVYEK